MRKYIFLLSLFTFTSCEIHKSDNGDFDGFWQMTNMQLHNGCKGENLNTLPFYWAVQGKILEVRNGDEEIGALFRFDRTKDSLTLYNPLWNSRSAGDIEITDSTELYQYGIYHLREKFQVIQLSSERMILQSDSVEFIFRKY